MLGIDTAGPVVGAALCQGQAGIMSCQVVEQWSERIVRGADSVLLPAIDHLVSRADKVSLVAVSVGPGAFTGLRVGVSSALGLATALGVPVLATSALAARAALMENGRVLALLDARKSRVYAGCFTLEKGVPVLDGQEMDCPLQDALPPNPFVAVGEGAVVYRSEIEAAGGRVAGAADRSPAAAVAGLGLFHAEKAVSPKEIGLRYLRPPDLGGGKKSKSF